MSNVYFELSDVYSEISGVYSEISAVYSELSDVYSEISAVYSEIPDVYSEILGAYYCIPHNRQQKYNCVPVVNRVIRYMEMNAGKIQIERKCSEPMLE